MIELERSLNGGGGQSDAFDLYFLAMCHYRLGKDAHARACYERARDWQQKKAPTLLKDAKKSLEELKRFQTEAEEMLRPVVK